MHGSNLGREMKGRPAVAGETENMATPDDYALVTQAILEQRAASPSACDTMLGLLETQQNAPPHRALFAARRYIALGFQDRQHQRRHQRCRLRQWARRHLVIAVFCDGFPDQHVGEQTIGEITRAALRATGVAAV